MPVYPGLIYYAHIVKESSILKPSMIAISPESEELACVVCGMAIPDASAAFSEEYHGRQLLFCRQECLKDFLEDPERYALGEEKPGK